MSEKKILFVDDDELILTGYKRLFSNKFNVEIEINGILALEKIKKHPQQYSVIVVDMQMPLISGLELLKQLKASHPEISRLMVTGMTDRSVAIDAVNQGEIFRFYEKPCKEEYLVKGITDGVKQHDLIMAEKEILNQTLQGIVALLVELLSKAHPILFERSKKVVDMIKTLSNHGYVINEWELKIAALLYNVGYFAIPEDILREEDEFKEKSISDVPLISAKLIAKIKRFSNISKILTQVNKCNDEHYNEDSRLITILYTIVRNIEIGIPMFKTLEDILKNHRLSPINSVREEKIISAVREYIVLPNIDEDNTMSVNVYTLKEGDKIASDIIGSNNKVIMAKGKIVTKMVIEMLIVFYEDSIIQRNVLVIR